MESYTSHSGKPSGVIAYDIGGDYIIVKFRDGRLYKYSDASCGRQHVENMKTLAISEEGLSTYISQEEPGYEWRR